MQLRLPLLLALLFLPRVLPALEPGAPIDYKPLAFNPERWEKRGFSTMLTPWRGERIVLLTPSADLDRDVMGALVTQLDAGWKVYEDLTGRSPGRHRHLDGLATIAAVPDAGLTCGVGCGFVGVSGIELGKFAQDDYPRLRKNPRDVPHYCFYEMGRNFYTFGGRHDSFTTGFAVFMRYVCLDALKLDDSERDTRRFIEGAEALHSASDMDWLQAFTMHGGLGEKAPRLKDAQGRELHPSDQPVLYASAMLRLRREFGGDDWVRRFFAELATAPEAPARNPQNALLQSRLWLLAASSAANRDLSPVFNDQWRLPVDDRLRHVLREADWTTPAPRLPTLLRQWRGE